MAEVFRQVEAKVQWLEGNKEAVLQFLLKNEEVRELFEVAQEDLEEEITEETVFKRFYEYTKGQSFMIYENTSISKIKDEVSKEFWMKDGNTMTLIWKDGELV